MEWVEASRGKTPPGQRPVKGGVNKDGEALFHAAAVIGDKQIPGMVCPSMVCAQLISSLPITVRVTDDLFVARGQFYLEGQGLHSSKAVYDLVRLFLRARVPALLIHRVELGVGNSAWSHPSLSTRIPASTQRPPPSPSPS